MWWTFTVTNADSPHVLAERLAAALGEDHPFFRGEVATDTFQVTRVFAWTERGFPVVAFGRFTTPDGGTLAHIWIRPSLWTLWALALVTGVALSVGFNAAPENWFAPWFCCGLIVFFWSLVAVVTKIEVSRCRTNLERILAQPTNTRSP